MALVPYNVWLLLPASSLSGVIVDTGHTLAGPEPPSPSQSSSISLLLLLRTLPLLIPSSCQESKVDTIKTSRESCTGEGRERREGREKVGMEGEEE